MEALEIPYQIGQYVVSLLPVIDDSEAEKRIEAAHNEWFERGPCPLIGQMASGILVEVQDSLKMKPAALWTRHGRWVVLGPGMEDYTRLFEALKGLLGLKFVKSCRGDEKIKESYSLWQVSCFGPREFDGFKIAEEGERLDLEEARRQRRHFFNLKKISYK